MPTHFLQYKVQFASKIQKFASEQAVFFCFSQVYKSRRGGGDYFSEKQLTPVCLVFLKYIDKFSYYS